MTEKNQSIKLDENMVNKIPDTSYAQIVSCISSEYDVTLIFHQGTPVKVGVPSDNKYSYELKEVARVVMPIETSIRLRDVLVSQLTETVSKKVVQKNSK